MMTSDTTGGNAMVVQTTFATARAFWEQMFVGLARFDVALFVWDQCVSTKMQLLMPLCAALVTLSRARILAARSDVEASDAIMGVAHSMSVSSLMQEMQHGYYAELVAAGMPSYDVAGESDGVVSGCPLPGISMMMVLSLDVPSLSGYLLPVYGCSLQSSPCCPTAPFLFAEDLGGTAGGLWDRPSSPPAPAAGAVPTGAQIWGGLAGTAAPGAKPPSNALIAAMVGVVDNAQRGTEALDHRLS